MGDDDEDDHVILLEDVDEIDEYDDFVQYFSKLLLSNPYIKL